MSSALITKNEVLNEDGTVTLAVDVERLKHMFYMLHGEVTTQSRAYKGAIQVSKSDVIILVKDIQAQLHLAHVRDYTILVGVGLEKSFIEKPFHEFESYSWNEPEKTKEITIKINFLYEDYDTGSPLKHAVFVRISKGIKPGNILQLMASNDNEQLDNIEDLMCPVFCRTDHVNDKLSKDLMRVVEDWHKGQKKPRLLTDNFAFLQRNRMHVARFIHYVFPSAAVFIMSYFAFLIPSILNAEHVLPAFVTLILLSKVVLGFLNSLGGDRAKNVYRKLSNLSGEDVMFDVTKGDDKEQSDILNKNISLFKDSRSIFIWTNVQAVSASLIAALLFELLK